MSHSNKNTPQPLLSIQELSTNFKNDQEEIKANKQLSFEIAHNEIFALVGESGSGKSVAAKSILGLLPYPKAYHPSGKIYFQSEQNKVIELLQANETTMQSLRGNEISIIFQEPLSALNPLHRVEKQISEVISQHNKTSKQELHQRCLQLMEEVQLDDPQRILKAYPHQLSGGQRQRIMIAIAIANRPQLLIADEPTTALDVTVQKEILDLLVELKSTLNLSVLLITHDLSIVKRYAQRVAVMRSGEIIESSDTQQLFSNPEHEYTKTLIDASHLNDSISNNKSTASETLLQVTDFGVFIQQKSGFLKPTTKKYLSKNINFNLKQGQTLGLVGESGSGKTTTILGLLGLLESSGSAIFKGKNICTLSSKEWRPLRKDIQIVFQDPFSSLSPRMSVEQIICEGLIIHEQLSAQALRQAAEDIIQEVGLDIDSLSRYPHEFSGGQRQRLAIARALILKPDLLILDEPTSALDKPIQAQIINLLESLQKKYQLSYIFISHDLNLVKHICDDVIVLKDGEAVEEGVVSEVFNQPQHEYTKKLINSILR